MSLVEELRQLYSLPPEATEHEISKCAHAAWDTLRRERTNGHAFRLQLVDALRLARPSTNPIEIDVVGEVRALAHEHNRKDAHAAANVALEADAARKELQLVYNDPHKSLTLPGLAQWVANQLRATVRENDELRLKAEAATAFRNNVCSATHFLSSGPPRDVDIAAHVAEVYQRAAKAEQESALDLAALETVATHFKVGMGPNRMAVADAIIAAARTSTSGPAVRVPVIPFIAEVDAMLVRGRPVLGRVVQTEASALAADQHSLLARLKSVLEVEQCGQYDKVCEGHASAWFTERLALKFRVNNCIVCTANAVDTLYAAVVELFGHLRVLAREALYFSAVPIDAPIVVWGRKQVPALLDSFTESMLGDWPAAVQKAKTAIGAKKEEHRKAEAGVKQLGDALYRVLRQLRNNDRTPAELEQLVLEATLTLGKVQPRAFVHEYVPKGAHVTQQLPIRATAFHSHHRDPTEVPGVHILNAISWDVDERGTDEHPQPYVTDRKGCRYDVREGDMIIMDGDGWNTAPASAMAPLPFHQKYQRVLLSQFGD